MNIPDGFEETAGLTEEFLAYVAERVAPYQKTAMSRRRPALPLTPTGKVLKTDGSWRVFAVRPGEWSSRLFVIDDLDEYAKAQSPSAVGRSASRS
ncbi:hypothetical protein OG259_39535 [Streptomyces sp. NBC_00250]|uniref:hypothetical protein n=1 Tax=Streptomyces sp. NBC_00250 TaxID=2903641 RepID=UPI002E2D1593|nr:hypothetical protein [Streptomyces sp. NBC_00250]